MDFFYFHNCIYERVWRENRRRDETSLATFDLLRTYPTDTKLIIVGDATMSPYEIIQAGGSVEHWNEEAGQVWVRRLLASIFDQALGSIRRGASIGITPTLSNCCASLWRAACSL